VIEKYELVNMIQKKKYYLDRLKSLVYGSLDIRERDNKKYIYVHYRKDGKVVTKYVGEYSDSLYNQILSNNIEVKEINKRIKIIQKYIEDNNYYEQDLNDNIKDNIDRVRENIDVLLYDLVKLEDINITHENIINSLTGDPLNNVKLEDVVKYNKIKTAYENILKDEYIKLPYSVELLCAINKMLNEDLIYLNDYNLNDVEKEISNIVEKDISVINKAIEIFLYLSRKNIFKKNNILTALLFSNVYLLSNGNGVLTIPEDLTDKFKVMLNSFSNGKDTRIIKKFVIARCYIKFEDEEKYIV
jgi:hypothetical protein